VWRNASGAGFRWPRSSLRVKLVAVLLCLLAAGAAVIVTAGASALRGQLIRQAGAQLRAYANELTSRPFQVLGTARAAPGATGPFDVAGARSPGAARMSGAARAAAAGAARAAAAASAPGALATEVAATGTYSIELRGPSGQLLLSAGPGTRPGLAVPAPFAPIPARTGVLRTVQATGGGEYLVIAEPVHLQARRLVYGYGADDFAVTSRPRTGQAGTLVVGLQLAGIGHTVRRLTLLAVAVSAAAILIAGGLAWAVIWLSLRPVTRAAQTAEAVAAGVGDGSTTAGGLSQRIPGARAGPGTGENLAESLNQMLSQLEERLTASAEAEAAARAVTARMGRAVESVVQALRRPVSLLHGLAEHWTHHDRRGAADAVRALDQVAAEAARAEAVLEEADDALLDQADQADQADSGPFTRSARQNRDISDSGCTELMKSRLEP
jgi:hypothetical protein